MDTHSRSGPRRSRRQRGQVMPILLFTLMALAVVFVMLHGVGGKTHDRIRLQQAADRAALTSANVTARAFNALSYLNEVIVFADAVQAIYDAIAEEYDPIFETWCSGEEADDCAYDDPFCAHMCQRRDAIVSLATARRDDLDALVRSTIALSTLLVRFIPTLGARYAERTSALRVDGEAGIIDRLRLFPGLDDPLPLQSDDIELRARVFEQAQRYFEEHIPRLDLQIFFFERTAFEFKNRAVARANVATGPYWDLPSGAPSQFREGIAIFAFVAREGGDETRAAQVRTLSAARSDDFADWRGLDVVIAAAEPWFTLAAGAPDSRAAWSARSRPVELTRQLSRPALRDAVIKDAERGPDSVLGRWGAAVVVEQDDDPRIPH